MTPSLPVAFMSFGFSELLVIGTVALLVFGGQLPDVMRSLGRAYARLREGLQEVSKPVREELKSVSSVPDPRREVQSAISEANKPLPSPDDTPPESTETEASGPEYDVGTDDEAGEPQPWPGAPVERTDAKTNAPSPPPTFEDDDEEPLPP
ncbi:MAG: twin-arginine translocase TatA/TatE family subunit [Planctomycetota bacterium]|nr:twin-arginine translocase TatA/TatE family subunit [Planctomycetota bacterium]